MILTILQILTIVISIITLIVNFLYTSHEKQKENQSQLTVTRSISKFRTLRDAFSEFATLTSVDVIKENIEAGDTEIREIDFWFDRVNASASVFFTRMSPSKIEEEKVLDKIKKIIELASEYYRYYSKNRKGNAKLEKALQDIKREFYVDFSLMDWANWENIIAQVSKDKYGTSKFDFFYDKVNDSTNKDSMQKENEKLRDAIVETRKKHNHKR